MIMSKKPKKSGKSIRLLFVLGSIAIIVIIFLRLYNMEFLLNGSKDLMPLNGNYDTAKLAIVLQRSPVYPKEQLRRLINIDMTWSRWMSSALLKESKLLAIISKAVPAFDITVLENIQLVGISPEKSSSPFFNLVRAFLEILFDKGDYKWILFGNDHTFIIPQNLVSFLSTLDSDILVYTGNKMFRNSIFFASGGAGAVTSSVAMKAFLIALVLQRSKYFENAMIDTFGDNWRTVSPFSSCLVTTGHEINFEFSSSCFCGIWMLEKWRDNDTADEIYVRLSNKTTLTLRKKVSPDSKILLADSTLSQHSFPDISVEPNKFSGCEATDKWSDENPGIKFAVCVQLVFGAPFTNSVDASGGERFNAYGPVGLVSGQVDDWYREAKAFEQGAVPSVGPLPVARDVISFHYVSPAEASLLFRMLSGSSRVDGPAELQLQWPKGGDIGPYAHPLSDIRTAESLYRLLSQTQVQRPPRLASSA